MAASRQPAAPTLRHMGRNQLCARQRSALYKGRADGCAASSRTRFGGFFSGRFSGERAGRPTRSTRSQHHGEDDRESPKARGHIHMNAHLHKAAHRISLRFARGHGTLRPAVFVTRPLLGAASGLPRIGFWRRLFGPCTSRNAGHLIPWIRRSRPLHLQRLSGPPGRWKRPHQVCRICLNSRRASNRRSWVVSGAGGNSCANPLI